MRILVTGSAGHLGEALIRTLRDLEQHEIVGLDIQSSPFTTQIGSVADRVAVRRAMNGVEAVFHTATLHKPHIVTHTRQNFIDTNVTGTLNLLEEAVATGVRSFVFTSSTSVFGDANTPPAEAPAAWITEDVTPVPKNIYGATKAAAEDLCQLFHRNQRLPCVVLRTSRFFPEADDDGAIRAAYTDANVKTNEFLHRRVDIADVVSAHLLASHHAERLGFRKYIISATTPFTRDDLHDLRTDAPSAVGRHIPGWQPEYERRGWKMFPGIGRVYINARARQELDWRPQYDFARVLASLRADRDPRSALAQAIGSKGYHDRVFANEPYPVA